MLVDELTERILRTEPDGYVRVAVDGAAASGPLTLAGSVGEALRAAGRPVGVVAAEGFLRPASLRFEHGREDPDAFYEDWLDADALAREVLEPLDAGGSGAYLPSLWDPARDRATRAGYVQAQRGSVLLVAGTLLLGRWLPFDLTVHLALSSGALARRTPPEQAWTLSAYERYAAEVDPVGSADLVVRWDDVRHPGLVIA